MEASREEAITCGKGYVKAATAGCHVAYLAADWILGVEPLMMEDYPGVEEEQLPEISICPESEVLTVINSNRDLCKSFFITIPVERTAHGNASFDIVMRDNHEQPLSVGHYRNCEGDDKECVTFVAVVAARSVMDLCFIESYGKGIEEVDLFSDVKDVPELPFNREIDTKEAVRILFPLQADSGHGEAGFLCTQGFGGRFTHFYPGTYFAIDLQCEVGTPVLAVGDGTVTAVRDDSTVGGIHAKNLFHWNSVTMQLTESGKFVEYVHVKRGSVLVAVGQSVTAGQVLCLSGDVGFCPTPHLHLQVHDSEDDNAPTVPFVFLSQEPLASAAEAPAFYPAPVAGQRCPPLPK